NRFLLDKMAEHGRGEAEYVMLSDDGSAAAKRFHERMRNPLLTDIEVDFGGLPVADVYPKRVPDLFSAKPLILHGRYTGPAKGSMRIAGRVAGRPFERTLNVDLPARETRHDVLATLWARTKIEDLMAQDYAGAQHGTMKEELRNQIIRLGLDFRLMTQFTAFVAVELKVVNEGGKVRRIEVPVEMPEGVSYEGVFGERKDIAMQNAVPSAMAYRATGAVSGGFVVGGTGSMARKSSARPREEYDRYASRDEKQEGASLPKQKAQLHPDVADLLKGVQTKANLIRNGKAELKLYVSANDPALLQQLKALGFEITEQDPLAMTITGRIAAEKVAELVKLEGIRYIAPK
ncbi:MAG: hypothetical protein JNL98_39930, partial [Bryobacterales bacterium]|nr:hypothetical protein [Bryobacterales bacterium]